MPSTPNETLAKRIKTNHELARTLWESGNIEARFLSILLIKPKTLTADQVDQNSAALKPRWRTPPHKSSGR
ncbi:hypothetical protein NZK35_12210 [Stieleria sp. ICT_E10.1]|uniref:hypothetical protein n=1 Tax=Stieleria sedimenti TaxID=2976331 RepID=UPI0021807E23|nr:hypothetical protein [Stieleria sedimenti]MCS7467409.1 hypothetical protein [Stieleria sedimenti]